MCIGTVVSEVGHTAGATDEPTDCAIAVIGSQATASSPTVDDKEVIDVQNAFGGNETTEVVGPCTIEDERNWEEASGTEGGTQVAQVEYNNKSGDSYVGFVAVPESTGS